MASETGTGNFSYMNAVFRTTKDGVELTEEKSTYSTDQLFIDISKKITSTIMRVNIF